ncbi:MAG: tRNA epoxyqueuosine(34) reductase QueG [Acidobacteria bacterium]|nr:tRNA epoxyqueuosine(34) reductase QueG [Acidobacteriota bacterium]
MDLDSWIRQRALELGFSRVGACAAHPPRDGARLRDWMAQGKHGTMEWMARTAAARLDPEKLLPGVRSVIVVALNYAAPSGLSPSQRVTADSDAVEGSTGGEPPSGRVSIYARGRDYHRVLIQRLEKLRRELQERVAGCRTRVCVDTSPLLERYWAQAAGLGWIGKNTNLIVERLGSWVFLGALLCDLEVRADSPGVDRCGTCRRCLEACPTKAFDGPWDLDSRRCVSYLTIEHRGEIEPDLARGMGDWVFGCDDCQTVCPWNRFAVPTAVADFDGDSISRLPLERLADLSETEFDALTRGRGLRRARRHGLRRNALVALGNSATARALGPLEKALDDPDPVLRRQAARSLARVGASCRNTGAHRALAARLGIEGDPSTARAIKEAMVDLTMAVGDTREARP